MANTLCFTCRSLHDEGPVIERPVSISFTADFKTCGKLLSDFLVELRIAERSEMAGGVYRSNLSERAA